MRIVITLQAVEDMCHHKMAESLYARLQKVPSLSLCRLSLYPFSFFRLSRLRLVLRNLCGWIVSLKGSIGGCHHQLCLGACTSSFSCENSL